jgi:KaiC/GvpD/RAD55 family RecA-like ATPase
LEIKSLATAVHPPCPEPVGIHHERQSLAVLRNGLLMSLGVLQTVSDVEEGLAPGHRAFHLRALDVAEMVAHRPPPVSWVAEPVVARGALTLLAGVAGQGKSLLAMALAIATTRRTEAVVAGIRVMPGRVLVVDAENGRNEIHRRVHALGLDADAIGRLTIMEAEGFNLASHLAELEEFVAKVRPTLLILDSWRSLWVGEERDEAQVAGVLDRLRNLARRYDTGALLIHHARRDGTGYRGSGAIAASVDLAFLLDREPGDPDHGRRRLRCEKSRLAPEPPPRWLRVASEDDLAGGGALIREADSYSKPGRAESLPGLMAAEILALLATSAPMTRSQIARKLGRSAADGTVGRALVKGTGDGALRELPGKTYAIASQAGNTDGNLGQGLTAPGAWHV